MSGDNGALPGPVTDPRAHDLRLRYRDLFGGDEWPVPVQAIAEDLLGLSVEEDELLEVSGLLLPGERRVIVNSQESPARRRFTVAHELGHWVCQCLEGTVAPIMCRDQDLSVAADRTLEREANVFAAELLMPEPAVRSFAATTAELADAFGVSGEAIAWRLYSFGLGGRPSLAGT